MSTLKVSNITDLNDAQIFEPNLMTAVASTSGTAIDFTSIPSWVKRITVMFSAVSTNGANNLLIQLGDAGGIEATGYLCSGAQTAGTGTYNALFTTGFGLPGGGATNVVSGAIVLTLLDGTTNTWCAQGSVGYSSAAAMLFTAGSKALSAALDQVRITTVGGTDAFDAGLINVMYE